MLVSEFSYHLPEQLIAQAPLPERVSSRMLHLDRTSGGLRDQQFTDFVDLLRTDDLVVFNNTRVFPARLYGVRNGSHAQAVRSGNPSAGKFSQGRVEILLTRQSLENPNEWECLVRPGRKIGIGERLYFGDGLNGGMADLAAEVIARGNFGERRIRFDPAENFFETIDRIGHVPLPPYIDRSDDAQNKERYQTVYASQRGSVAAPTAGLHFTPDVLDAMKNRGIETAEITLHVGLGTFQPIRSERVEDHTLHREAYEISGDAERAINQALSQKRRVVAIGTTTVRTLEYSAQMDLAGRVRPGRGDANIFIYPGYEFKVVGAMLTNFHLPESTLLMLVCAFGGKDRIMAAYEHAVRDKYRFYSYGDCMFVE